MAGDVLDVAARVEGLDKGLEARVLATGAVWARVPAEALELYRLA